MPCLAPSFCACREGILREHLSGCLLLLLALAALLFEGAHFCAQGCQLLPGCLLLCRQRLCATPLCLQLPRSLQSNIAHDRFHTSSHGLAHLEPPKACKVSG